MSPNPSGGDIMNNVTSKLSSSQTNQSIQPDLLAMRYMTMKSLVSKREILYYLGSEAKALIRQPTRYS